MNRVFLWRDGTFFLTEEQGSLKERWLTMACSHEQLQDAVVGMNAMLVLIS